MATLAGKVAIVTGASRGIGRAIAEKLSHEGASVVINYSRSVDEAKTVLTGIESRAGAASLCQADIGKVADVRRLFKETISRFAHVDIVVNNAATAIFG